MSTLVLVHGAWHDGWCWTSVADALRAGGHVVLTPDLPVDDPDADLATYAAVVFDAVRDGPGVEEPVVVVGHSLSSAVIAQVPVLLDVELLVYLTPRCGGFRGPPQEPQVFVSSQSLPRDDLRRTWWPPERAIGELYGRLDPALATEAATHLRPQVQVWRGEHPAAVPPEVPSALVLAAEDEVLAPRWSRWAARHMLGLAPIELPGGHFAMLEQPDVLAALLEELAARGGTLPAPPSGHAGP